MKVICLLKGHIPVNKIIKFNGKLISTRSCLRCGKKL